MADHPHFQAQRSDSNVFAFRRLKWGAPPKQFRVESILRARPSAPIQRPLALLNHDEMDGVATGAEPLKDIPLVAPATDLNKRRMREGAIDTAVWAAAILSVLSLAAALIWTGWSH